MDEDGVPINGNHNMKIIATYPTVLAAVEENIEKFGYNPEEARRSAKYSDCGFGRDPGAKDVWLLEDGNVWFVYVTKDGLKILNKVSFHSCIDSSPFAVVKVDLAAGEVSPTEFRFSKGNWKLAAEFCSVASVPDVSYVLGSAHDRLSL